MVLKEYHYLAAHILFYKNIPYSYYLRQRLIGDQTFILKSGTYALCESIYESIECGLDQNNALFKDIPITWASDTYKKCKKSNMPYLLHDMSEVNPLSFPYAIYAHNILLKKAISNTPEKWFELWMLMCHYPNMLDISFEECCHMVCHIEELTSLPYTFASLNLVASESLIRSALMNDFMERSFLNFHHAFTAHYEKIPLHYIGKLPGISNIPEEKIINLQKNDGPRSSINVNTILDLDIPDSNYKHNLYMMYWLSKMQEEIPQNAIAQENYNLLQVLLLTLSTENKTNANVLKIIDEYYANKSIDINCKELSLFL